MVDAESEDRRIADWLLLEAEVLRKRAALAERGGSVARFGARVLKDAAGYIFGVANVIESGRWTNLKQRIGPGLPFPSVAVGQSSEPPAGPFRTFGGALRGWREFLGLSATGFARMLHVDEATVKRWSALTKRPADRVWTELWARILSGQFVIPATVERALTGDHAPKPGTT